MVSILGKGFRYAASYCDCEFTFDVAIVTLNLKPCPSYISETLTCGKWILGRDTG